MSITCTIVDAAEFGMAIPPSGRPRWWTIRHRGRLGDAWTVVQANATEAAGRATLAREAAKLKRGAVALIHDGLVIAYAEGQS